jgi:hypothetical protein
MSAHTKGRWVACSTSVVIEREDGATAEELAQCFGNDSEANARLMAAAPDLLDAGRHLWAFIERLSNEDIQVSLSAAMAFMKARQAWLAVAARMADEDQN